MKIALRSFFVAVSLCTIAVGLAGCNTMDGVGEDIEEAGEGIQDGAN